jgi:hypothetical protein
MGNGEWTLVSRLTSRDIQKLENVSLAEWTPSKMLKRFNVEYLSPCVGAGEMFFCHKGRKGRKEVSAASASLREITITPSLRMNACDEISVEALEKFDSAGCRVVDISVDDVAKLTTHNSQLTTLNCRRLRGGTRLDDAVAPRRSA